MNFYLCLTNREKSCRFGWLCDSEQFVIRDFHIFSRAFPLLFPIPTVFSSSSFSLSSLKDPREAFVCRGRAFVVTHIHHLIPLGQSGWNGRYLPSHFNSPGGGGKKLGPRRVDPRKFCRKLLFSYPARAAPPHKFAIIIFLKTWCK